MPSPAGESALADCRTIHAESTKSQKHLFIFSSFFWHLHSCFHGSEPTATHRPHREVCFHHQHSAARPYPAHGQRQTFFKERLPFAYPSTLTHSFHTFLYPSHLTNSMSWRTRGRFIFFRSPARRRSGRKTNFSPLICDGSTSSRVATPLPREEQAR